MQDIRTRAMIEERLLPIFCQVVLKSGVEQCRLKKEFPNITKPLCGITRLKLWILAFGRVT